MKETKKEWIQEQCKNREKGMMSGNSREAYNNLKALMKTQQHKSAVNKDSSGNILMESTGRLSTAVAYTPTNSLQTLVYSRVTKAPHTRLKAFQCWGKR